MNKLCSVVKKTFKDVLTYSVLLFIKLTFLYWDYISGIEFFSHTLKYAVSNFWLERISDKDNSVPIYIHIHSYVAQLSKAGPWIGKTDNHTSSSDIDGVESLN